jgi:hypothetical protein
MSAPVNLYRSASTYGSEELFNRDVRCMQIATEMLNNPLTSIEQAGVICKFMSQRDLTDTQLIEKLKAIFTQAKESCVK